MPQFSYFAKSLKGEEKKGILEAKDSQSLARLLKEEGFLLVKADVIGGSAKAQEPQKKSSSSLEINIPFLSGVSLTEKMLFTRNLQVMISSGLSLPRSLETLALQTKSGKFRRALLDVREKVVKGENFSDTLQKYPDIFSDLFQNMIKVGEESGTMEKSLEALSHQMEREHELKSKIKEAMMYPSVIITAMIGIGILMLVMVVPKLAQTFDELGVDLPLTTRAVIAIAEFLTQKWYLAILMLAVAIFFGGMAFKNSKVKKFVDPVILKIPVISSLVQKTNAAYTVRTLSSLIAAGVPIVRSLEIVAGVISNSRYKGVIISAVNRVGKGEKLSDAFRSSGAYPPIVFQMMQVGEETGETAKVLAKLAEFFEEELGSETKNLTSVIEPVLMLIIGGVVGFFAISMVQPMYSMLGAIQ